MIGGLVHRCTIWQAVPGPADAYGQPAAVAQALQARALRCRFTRGESGTHRLLLPADAAVAIGDRVTDIQEAAGRSIDHGPFRVNEVTVVTGRAQAAYQSAVLQRFLNEDAP